MARRHGYSDDLLEHLSDSDQRADLSGREKAAVRFAERMTLDPQAISDAEFAELRAHFDEGEVVELAAAIGLFNYFNRFNDALRMEPTR